jgi:hypothetical protein
MRMFYLHTSEAKYELKVVLLRVNFNKTIGGFMNIPLADLSHINLRHDNITILLVLGRPRQYTVLYKESDYVRHTWNKLVLTWF